jgi:hypothetical protein
LATQRDVRRIALSIPGAVGDEDRFAYGVLVKGKLKHFVWEWRERVDPKKSKVPNDRVVVVRVADLDAKEKMLASSKTKFFTESHYDGYASVLVRLEKIKVPELRKVILSSLHCIAPEK